MTAGQAMRAWGWAAVMGLAGACGGSGDGASEGPVIPPPPPREVRVHEPSGALLSLPAPDWHWVEGPALSALEATAVLGLKGPKACEGWVAVSEAKEGNPPRGAAAAGLAARQAEATWAVHVDEDVLYASHTARRWEIQRREGEASVSERTSFLVEGPRLFVVHARSREALYANRRRCLDAVTAAFDVNPYVPPKH